MDSKYEQLKLTVSSMIENAGSGHYASSISALQIMYPLFYEQGVKPDEFILSKGHAAPALYAILYDLGYISNADISLFRDRTGLPGHPSLETNGVLCSSGSLGMGISKAIGLAHVNKDKVYHVLVGDGELQEGQNWEALMYIAANNIQNLMIHVDVNGHQYSGETNPRIHEAGLSGDCIILHHTLWEHDNHYLTKPKKNPKVTEYCKSLLKFMNDNKKVVVLNADLEHDFYLTGIKLEFPDRYIQCGISEQHMVSMAGGLARAGMLPICHTYGAFYRRAVDQMWNNGCDRLQVIYVAGLTEQSKVNIGRSHEASPVEYLYQMIPLLIEITSFDHVLLNSEFSFYWEVW